MKLFLGLVVATASLMLQAAPGVYTGTGQSRRVGQTTPDTYQVAIDIKAIDPGKVMESTETYTMKGQAPVTHTIRYAFATDGTVKITDKGVAIGCGYCVDQGNGSKWCDFRLHIDMGPLHVSWYYDAATHTHHRLADVITPGGPVVFNENLTKAN